MFPVLIEIGKFQLRTYGVLVAIAAIAGIFAALKYVVKKGVNEDAFLNVVIFTLIFGILGARVFWVFVSPYLSTYLKNPISILAFWEGGLSFEGMILGGLLALYIFSKVYKIPFKTVLDSGALGVSIGYGIGKFACFFNGCCYGKPVPSWWPKFFPFSLIFTNPKSQCDLLNTPLYPAQLLNALSGLITFAILLLIFKKNRSLPEGKLFVYFSLIFSPMLFLIEFIRYIPNSFLGLTPNQWFAIGFVIFGLLFDYFNKRENLQKVQ